MQKLIPVWLQNRWGLACGVIGIYILWYIAWTQFHWGATENFRLIPGWDMDRNFALISDLAYQPVSLLTTIVAWQIAFNVAFSSQLRRAWFILGLAVAFQTLGDTVNIASRMESQGLPGRIQVTQRCYERLQTRHSFEKRGVILVNGKGEMTAYLLDGPRPTESSSPA